MPLVSLIPRKLLHWETSVTRRCSIPSTNTWWVHIRDIVDALNRPGIDFSFYTFIHNSSWTPVLTGLFTCRSYKPPQILDIPIQISQPPLTQDHPLPMKKRISCDTKITQNTLSSSISIWQKSTLPLDSIQKPHEELHQNQLTNSPKQANSPPAKYF